MIRKRGVARIAWVNREPGVDCQELLAGDELGPPRLIDGGGEHASRSVADVIPWREIGNVADQLGEDVYRAAAPVQHALRHFGRNGFTG